MGFYRYIDYAIKCVIRKIIYSEWFWRILFLIIMVFVCISCCNNAFAYEDQDDNASDSVVYGSIFGTALNALRWEENILVFDDSSDNLNGGLFFKLNAGFDYVFELFDVNGNRVSFDNIYYCFTDEQPGPGVQCTSSYVGDSDINFVYSCMRDCYIYFYAPVSQFSYGWTVTTNYYDNSNYQTIYSMNQQICNDVDAILYDIYYRNNSSLVSELVDYMLYGAFNIYCNKAQKYDENATFYIYLYSIDMNSPISSRYYNNIGGVPCYHLYYNVKYTLSYDESNFCYRISKSSGGTQNYVDCPLILSYNNFVSCFSNTIGLVREYDKSSSDIAGAIDNQTQNFDSTINNSTQKIEDTMTSTDYDDSTINIDTSVTDNIDDSAATGLFTAVFNNLSNLISSSNWSTVETIDIGLPYTDAKIQLRSDLLSKIVGNSLLSTLITVAWYSLFGLYVFRFSTHIFHAIKSGDILNGLNLENEVISSTML